MMTGEEQFNEFVGLAMKYTPPKFVFFAAPVEIDGKEFVGWYEYTEEGYVQYEPEFDS